ncbi:MBL fold metallo-hydrolase [Halosimplex aquaticum]
MPTPFQVGPVNAYLADRTLVDPGPDSDEAWSALTDALAERDLAPGDIERLLITHPHPDHFGLASRFRGRGASVVAHPDAAAIMADFPVDSTPNRPTSASSSSAAAWRPRRPTPSPNSPARSSTTRRA